MKQHKFYGPWCSFFQYCLDRSGTSQYLFSDLVEETQPSINQYLTGRSKPPIEKIVKYADVLKLNKDDRERFIWLAHQSYTPTVVWDRVIKLENLVTSMESKISRLEQQMVDSGLQPLGTNNENVK